MSASILELKRTGESVAFRHCCGYGVCDCGRVQEGLRGAPYAVAVSRPLPGFAVAPERGLRAGRARWGVSSATVGNQVTNEPLDALEGLSRLRTVRMRITEP